LAAPRKRSRMEARRPTEFLRSSRRSPIEKCLLMEVSFSNSKNNQVQAARSAEGSFRGAAQAPLRAPRKKNRCALSPPAKRWGSGWRKRGKMALKATPKKRSHGSFALPSPLRQTLRPAPKYFELKKRLTHYAIPSNRPSPLTAPPFSSIVPP
jgi:hypothetical protein